MSQCLKEKYEKVITTSDYVVAIGDIPVALVAHLDTAFKKPPNRIFYDNVKNVMWSPEGLGADDRAGVYSIIQIIKSGLRPTIIFTTDEEKGGLGAERLVKDMPDPPTDLKYIIELDRQGRFDCVFYRCDNPEFERYVEDFGFITNFGSFSDISIICPRWKVAGVNLSIGYVDEHSVSETLYISHMYNTINKVKDMLKNAETADHYDFIESINSQWYRLYPTVDAGYDWDPSYGISKEDWFLLTAPQRKCTKCGNFDYEYNLFPVKTSLGEFVYMCVDCITSTPEIDWCIQCGEPYFKGKNSEDKLCVDCKGALKNAKNGRNSRDKKSV